MRTNKFITFFEITAALLPGSISVAQVENSGVYVGAVHGTYNVNDGALNDNDRVIKTLTRKSIINGSN